MRVRASCGGILGDARGRSGPHGSERHHRTTAGAPVSETRMRCPAMAATSRFRSASSASASALRRLTTPRRSAFRPASSTVSGPAPCTGSIVDVVPPAGICRMPHACRGGRAYPQARGQSRDRRRWNRTYCRSVRVGGYFGRRSGGSDSCAETAFQLIGRVLALALLVAHIWRRDPCLFAFARTDPSDRFGAGAQLRHSPGVLAAAERGRTRQRFRCLRFRPPG